MSARTSNDGRSGEDSLFAITWNFRCVDIVYNKKIFDFDFKILRTTLAKIKKADNSE